MREEDKRCPGCGVHVGSGYVVEREVRLDPETGRTVDAGAGDLLESVFPLVAALVIAVMVTGFGVRFIVELATTSEGVDVGMTWAAVVAIFGSVGVIAHANRFKARQDRLRLVTEYECLLGPHPQGRLHKWVYGGRYGDAWPEVVVDLVEQTRGRRRLEERARAARQAARSRQVASSRWPTSRDWDATYESTGCGNPPWGPSHTWTPQGWGHK
jgi:hypothetical protein